MTAAPPPPATQRRAGAGRPNVVEAIAARRRGDIREALHGSSPAALRRAALDAPPPRPIADSLRKVGT